MSPLLANIALHGMEDALGVKHDNRGQIRGPRAVVRYADGFVVLCESKEDAEAVVDRLKEWLAERGLPLSEDKTRIVHLTEGFDFLGFNVRHYGNKSTKTGSKLLITPSKESEKRIRIKLRDKWNRMQGSNTQAVLKTLNPLIRGWANYHRVNVASKAFGSLDNWMFQREVRYIKRAHPTKPKYWTQARYFGRMNRERQDNWVFGDKLTGGYLLKFSWFKIERHALVNGTTSPDDPARREYWSKRTAAKTKNLPPRTRKIAYAQNSVCPLCGESIHNGEEIHKHHVHGRRNSDEVILLHLYCHQKVHETVRNPA
ncbi:MAG: group II intron maturase-specific domain-containing protein [Thermomicrobiales bacterium]